MAVIAVDFDGTLYRGNSITVMLRAGRKHFTIKDWLLFLSSFTKILLIGFSKGKEEVRIHFFKSFARMFKGKKKEELDYFFSALVEQGISDVDKGLLTKIEKHQKDGDHILILSGSLEPFLQVFIKHLGLNVSASGTALLFDDDGICTGEIGPVNHGEHKVEQLRHWIEKQDLQEQEVWAYADSQSDIPLFEYVHHPVVVNPSVEMKDIAEIRGWMILSH